MKSESSVARSVLETLSYAGVKTIFGLPGVHNLAFWRELGHDVPKILGVRHEQTTVYAADGAARATGQLGVALSTTGPGAANAVAAFGEAAASGSPVLLIATEISTALARRDMLRGVLHESPNQAAMFEPLAKAVFRPRTAIAAVAAVATAVETAMSWPRGPVYVDIPTDVLDLSALPVATATPRRQVPAMADVERAAALIDSSAFVVIWAGGGVVQAQAEQELRHLSERLSAPVVNTFAANGVLPTDHPCWVGLPPHEPEVAQLIGGADLLVAIGTDFDGMNTRNWTMPRPKHLVVINCDANKLDRNYVPDVAIHGDAKLALELLTDTVCKRDEGLLAGLEVVRTAAWARLRSEPASAAGCQLAETVGAVARRHDAVVVADMAIPGYWVGGYGHFGGPRRLQYPVGWGTLGFAVPASVGVGATGRATLAVCGDGGFMFAVGELAVMVQEHLPVTILLVDDGGYGMLRYDQRHSGDQERGVDLVHPDFVELARAFGIETTTLGSEEGELEEALDTALQARAPHLVLMRASLTPPRTTSPRWTE